MDRLEIEFGSSLELLRGMNTHIRETTLTWKYLSPFSFRAALKRKNLLSLGL